MDTQTVLFVVGMAMVLSSLFGMTLLHLKRAVETHQREIERIENRIAEVGGRVEGLARHHHRHGLPPDPHLGPQPFQTGPASIDPDS